MTLAPVSERLAVELTITDLRIRSVSTKDRTLIFRMQDERSTTEPPRSNGKYFKVQAVNHAVFYTEG